MNTGRVPHDVAAFCAGLRSHPSDTVIPWDMVAASVSELGLGAFTAEEVRDATNAWCEETMKMELDAEDAADEAAELERRRKNAS
jgi:hypothetical protein